MNQEAQESEFEDSVEEGKSTASEEVLVNPVTAKMPGQETAAGASSTKKTSAILSLPSFGSFASATVKTMTETNDIHLTFDNTNYATKFNHTEIIDYYLV